MCSFRNARYTWLYKKLPVSQCVKFIEQPQCFKPGLHISRKDRKHMPANTLFKLFQVCLGLFMVVMIAGIHISQELFAIDMLTALKSSLKHVRKHVLRL